MAAVDTFTQFTPGLAAPYSNAATVTPNDSTDLATVTRALFVGTAGNIVVTMLGGGSNVTLTPLAGQTLPLRITRVLATGTTAGDIVALW
jgi:hypothetical protein